MGFGGYKIYATRADEPKSNAVFYGEALAAFAAGCAGYAEASRLIRKTLLIKSADGRRNAAAKKRLCLSRILANGETFIHDYEMTHRFAGQPPNGPR
jgi:hypothetical protein